MVEFKILERIYNNAGESAVRVDYSKLSIQAKMFYKYITNMTNSKAIQLKGDVGNNIYNVIEELQNNGVILIIKN